ncbi:MAG: ral secretion pathway protein [Gemmatimonadetes bacterium]|nr:ral secretion pathway protein [Gemmatimonadota bacterium]
MLTMLWIMSVASVAAMTAALAGRNTVDAGRNRVELERAYWKATGCARRAQAAIDEELTASPSIEGVNAAWRTLQSSVPASTLLTGCDVALEAAGTRIDLNAATDEMITNLATMLGYGAGAAEMAAALHDWIDPDDSLSAGGAEQAWYQQARRLLPRNAPLADSRELSRVRGFEDFSPFDSLVSVEPGRVSLATASATVLTALPGITSELADAIVVRQQAGAPVAELSDVLGSVSRASADALASRYPDAVRLTTPDPDAWVVRSTAVSGLRPSKVVLQWRLARLGRRAIVVQTRTIQ